MAGLKDILFGFDDSSLGDRVIASLFRGPVQREAERRMRELYGNRTAIERIENIISYDMSAYQNYMRYYFDPNPIHRNPHFKGLQSFFEVDQDSSILSKYNQRQDTLINRPWSIKPAIENNRDEVIKAGFARCVIKKIRNLHKVKKGFLSHQKYGYSVSQKKLAIETVRFPITLRTGKNKTTTEIIEIKDAFVVKEIESIVPTAFSFDKKRRMYFGQPNLTSKHRLVNPDEQVNLIRTTFDDRFGSPYGWPLNTAIFPHRIMKKAVMGWRSIFLEKHGIPPISGEVPPHVMKGTPDYEEFKKGLDSLMHTSRIIHPKDYVVKFIEMASRAGTVDMFQNTINYHDQCTAELILGHKQATEATSVGSLASSTVKEAALRQGILEFDCMDLDTFTTEQLVEYLIDLNFPPNGYYPEHYTNVETFENQKDRLEIHKGAAEMNIRGSQTQFMRDLHIDSPLDEFDAIEPAEAGRVLRYIGKNSKEANGEDKGYSNGEDKNLAATVKFTKQQKREIRRYLIRQAKKDYKKLLNGGLEL